MSIKDLVNDYLQNLPEDTKFGMRDICQYIYTTTAGQRNPLDGTVGRTVRAWRADNPEYTVICVDYGKAQYIKTKKKKDLN